MTFGGRCEFGRAFWFVLVFYLTLVPTVQAAEPTVQLEARVGFGGFFLHHAWSPLFVDVTSAHPSDVQLEISIPRNDLLSAAQTYVSLKVPMTIGHDGRQRFHVNVPLLGSPYPLKVRITGPLGQTLAQEEIPLRNAAIEGPLYVVLDPMASGWTWLTPYVQGSNAQDPRQVPRVVHIQRSEDVPAEPQVFAPLAAIIIKDTFPVQTLTKHQIDAISAYVRAGGHLVLVGGSTPPDLPLLWRAWLDELTDQVTAMPGRQNTRLPAWEVLSLDGTVVFDPLEKEVGSGKITLFPFNPSSQLLDESVRQDAATRLMFDPYDRLKTTFNDDEVWRLLGLTELAFDEDVPLTLSLVLYAVVVTGLMVVLGRGRSTRWILAAVIGVATFGAWFFVDRSGLKDGVVYAEVQLTQGLQNGMAIHRSYGLLVPFGPEKRQVAVESPRPLMFPASHQSHLDINTTLDGNKVYYQFDNHTGPLALFRDQYDRLDVHVRLVDRASRLQVVNDMPMDLQFTYLIDGRRLISLGDIPAGTVKEWAYPPEALPGLGWVGINLQAQLMRQPKGKRPDDFAIRLLSLAADRGFEGALSQRPSFIVALIPATPVAHLTPGGRSKRWHVVMIPMAITSEGEDDAHDLG